MRRSIRIKQKKVKSPKKQIILQTIEVVDDKEDSDWEDPLANRIKQAGRNPARIISPTVFVKKTKKQKHALRDSVEGLKSEKKCDTEEQTKYERKLRESADACEELTINNEYKNDCNKLISNTKGGDSVVPCSSLLNTNDTNNTNDGIKYDNADTDYSNVPLDILLKSPVKSDDASTHKSSEEEVVPDTDNLNVALGFILESSKSDDASTHKSSPEEEIPSPERNAKDKICAKLIKKGDTNEICSAFNKGTVLTQETKEQVHLTEREEKGKSCDRICTISADGNKAPFISSENIEQVADISIEKPKAQIVCKPLKIGLDRSNYEKLGFNKFACNPLMQTLFELKKSFPFKDHVRESCSHEGSNSNYLQYDILSLDSISLANKTPVNTNDLSQLSSHVQAPVEPELYFDMSATTSREIDLDKQVGNLMKKSVLQDDLEKMEKAPKFFVAKNQIKAQSKKEQAETAGKGWYNLPRTVVTDKIKNDLQLIKMRNALDPKRHYKRNDSNKLPEYFQIGKVVEGAHEFYSARVPQGKRKKTMVDELLDDAEFRRKNKKKYIEIRKKQTSGGKGFYKKLKNKRKETWERT